MTSTVRKCNGAPGFTLLEIVMVLVIACMMLAGAAGMMIYSSDEHTLRNASGEIELLAKRARTIAILHQTPYALEFREGVVRLLPLAQAGQIERRTAGGHRIGGEPVIQVGEHRQFVLDGGMSVAVRRWDSEAWLGTDKNSIHVWRFDPNGLCEPISVRLSLAKAWSEDIYHPLTATIRESIRETR